MEESLNEAILHRNLCCYSPERVPSLHISYKTRIMKVPEGCWAFNLKILSRRPASSSFSSRILLGFHDESMVRKLLSRGDLYGLV